ncbi:MAG: hypothetical protein O2923_10240 [Verrucomicrobia bacterium]|nr:hypothetical protein [Verrucomicrobiota bacterium]MDA1087658.1 hypothetical protein [Verrucomicrobiota bacterium]
MADDAKTTETRNPNIPTGELTRLTDGIALLVVNTLHNNWLSNTDAQETLAYCYRLLSTILEKTADVTFRIRGDVLEINAVEMGRESATIQAFIQQLKVVGVDNFSVKQGVEPKTLSGLLEILTASPREIQQLGGFSSAVDAVGIRNVSSKTIVYKEVTEDDVIVSKEDFEQAKTEFDQSKEIQDRVSDISEVLSLLKADAKDEKAANAIQQIRDMATDAQRLAGVVVHAAEAKKDEAEEQARETMSTALVGCMRNAFNTLMEDPKYRTQKGKKELKKYLEGLEREILGTIGDIDATEQAECKAAVADTVEQMQDELQIDALASEYMRKMKQMEKTEKRLLRYMKAKGQDGIEGSPLQVRLSEEGLAMDVWQDLMFKSDVMGGPGGPGGPGGGGGSGDGAAIEHLASLLTRMEEVVGNLATAPNVQSREDLTGVLTAVNQEIDQIVTVTTQKIDRIAKKVRADEVAVEETEEEARKRGIGIRLSRKQLLELLAEIVQELFQPLAVINCAVDMMTSERLGEVSASQVDVLSLASDSTRKLRSLVDGLLQISGFPSTTSPDTTLIESLGSGDADAT